jgi:hypothetical protein
MNADAPGMIQPRMRRPGCGVAATKRRQRHEGTKQHEGTRARRAIVERFDGVLNIQGAERRRRPCQAEGQRTICSPSLRLCVCVFVLCQSSKITVLAPPHARELVAAARNVKSRFTFASENRTGDCPAEARLWLLLKLTLRTPCASKAFQVLCHWTKEHSFFKKAGGRSFNLYSNDFPVP